MAKDVLDYRVFTDGEYLFEKGSRGSEAYLIIDGQVRIVNYDENDDEEIGVRGPSDIVGEMAIISNEPRMAMARAVGETHCYAFSRQMMNKIIESADLETRSLVHFLIEFLRDLHLKIRGEPIIGLDGDETPESEKAWEKRVLIARRFLDEAKTEAEPAHLEPILRKLRLVLLKRVRETLADLEKSAAK